MSGIAWMRRLGSFLTLRVLFMGLGAIAVALIVWFGGPLIAIAGWTPLSSAAARIIFLLLIVVSVLARYLWHARRQRRDNEMVVSEMMASSEKDDLLREEADTQRDRLRQALAMVRKWKPGRFRSIYELPWYMIIGAPGSGKSTALLNSGLEFPLKDEMGIDSVRGVGGTRYCDWWFTNRAVIIDTAGRYTTQESADRRDSRGWNSFLGLLKKYRSRQPINGVILSISVADLLEQTPTEQMLHARALKQRVQELKNRLGVVFPVYVVLTKFDLLEGFSDTFGMLSEREREEVFGMTFDLHSVTDSGTLPATFDGEFDQLLERLSQFLLHRLQQERTPATRRRIYQFPKQTALLRAPLWNLIKEVFSPSAYEEVPLLRGIYLVSSEQGGRTLDKVSRLVDDQFRLQVPETRNPARPATQDGFFLRHLFENIVFSESGLASADGRKEQQFIWLRRAVFAGLGLVTLGLGSAWAMSYQWNTDLIALYESEVEELGQALAEPHQDWVKLDGILSKAAGIPGVQGSPMPAGKVTQMGLYQGDTLADDAGQAYGRLLALHFGSRLKETQEAAINGNLANLEYLYETLKTYLMLNQLRHLDRDQVYAWFDLMLSRQLPGEVNRQSRESLLAHLGHYLNLEVSFPLDEELVARARAELTSMPLAERAYQRIKMDASLSSLPSFRLPMVLGSVADRVFERRSGRSLKEGVPGFYTINGYQGIFEPEKNKIVSRLLEDSWVYGEESQDFRNLDEAAIRTQVADRYFRDYVHVWEEFLGDLRVRSFASQTDGMRVAGALAGPEAPIGRLMKAVRLNTELSRPDETSAGADAAGDAASSRLAQRSRALSGLMQAMPGEAEEQTTLVDRAFKPMHQIEDETFDRLQAEAKLIARYFEEQSGGRPAALATVSRDQFDEAVRGFFSTAGDNGSALFTNMFQGFVSDSRRQVKVSVTRKINEIWRSMVYSDYQQAIAGNYPFTRESVTDVALTDFANFFGYGGTLDQFFERYLAIHVDTSQSPWRLKNDIGISRRSLQLFENARKIREAFFERGSRTPAVAFALKPVYLDSRITQFMLDIDGQTLVYRHGPARTVGFSWPEQAGARQTRISLTPGRSEQESAQQTWQGTWAVFRMLQAAGAMNTSSRTQGLNILLDEYLARLELTTGSVKHPFDAAMLESFRLPSSL
ncbi:type VI secretion system membrane subunit TssM [Marinobacter sp.]|uniref:type VI secretion system membrane subunit TssM n=1 Tax=Marinobacter sp. TaxID=50741 RepID=UPI00384D6B3C